MFEILPCENILYIYCLGCTTLLTASLMFMLGKVLYNQYKSFVNFLFNVSYLVNSLNMTCNQVKSSFFNVDHMCSNVNNVCNKGTTLIELHKTTQIADIIEKYINLAHKIIDDPFFQKISGKYLELIKKMFKLDELNHTFERQHDDLNDIRTDLCSQMQTPNKESSTTVASE